MEIVASFISLYPELVGLTLVILIDWFAPFPAKYSPTQFFRLLASAFVKKLAHSGSTDQQTLSGWLSLLTYLFLLLAILFSVLFISENDVWTQALLLYLSLGYQPMANQAKTISQCVANDQKSAARSLLKLNSPYDTSRLTLLGINKLSIELTTIYFVSTWVMPVVLFLLFDGVVAFAYRAIIEAYFCWLPQVPSTRYFGKGVTFVKNTIELLPTVIIAPIYSIFSSSPNWLRYLSSIKPEWKKSKASSTNTLMWLSIVSAGCKSELAGPLMIDGEKIARPRINKNAPINEQAITHLLNWNNRFRFSVVLFNTVTLVALFLTQ